MRAARVTLTIAATLVIAAACSTSKKKEIKGDVSALEGLFPDGKPVLPAMFGKHSLEHGMTRTAAREAAPEFSSGSLQTEEFEGARFGWDAHDDGRGIFSLYVELKVEPADAQSMLTGKWGEPKKGSDEDGDRWYWFNSGSRLRVVLYKNRLGWMHVSFERYMPLADLLGTHEAMLGWETKPIFGMIGDDVAANYAEHLKGVLPDEGEAPGTLLLPPTEYADATMVLLNYRDDVVTGLQFLLSADAYFAGIDELLEVFKAKYGDPKAAGDGSNAVIFNDSPLVRVERVENGLTVLIVEAPKIEME